jgi:Tfp pilus assembly protein PilV
MKRLDKLALFNRRGETLVESIISITILAILLTSITALTAVSLIWIGNSMRDARDSQEQINAAILGTNLVDSGINVRLISSELFEPDIDATIPVLMAPADSPFNAFAPPEGTP